MRTKVKDRFIGLISATAVSTISFLVFNYFGSFETKANAASKYVELKQDFAYRHTTLDLKLSLVLCYLKPEKHCTPELEGKITGNK